MLVNLQNGQISVASLFRPEAIYRGSELTLILGRDPQLLSGRIYPSQQYLWLATAVLDLEYNKIKNKTKQTKTNKNKKAIAACVLHSKGNNR